MNADRNLLEEIAGTVAADQKAGGGTDREADGWKIDCLMVPGAGSARLVRGEVITGMIVKGGE